MALYTNDVPHNKRWDGMLYKSELYDKQSVHENALYSTRHYSSRLYEGEKTLQEKCEEDGFQEILTLPTDGLVQWLFSPTSVFSDNQITDAQGDETRTIHPGRAYLFDGVDDLIVSDSNIDLSHTNKVTVSLWCKIPAGGHDVLIEHSPNFNNNNGFIIWYNNANLWVGIHDSSGYNQGIYTGWTYDTLMHLVAVYDKDLTPYKTKLYINGVEQVWSSYPYQTGSNSNFANFKFYIGARSNPTFVHRDIISDVRLYDRVLTPEEALFLYTNGEQGTDPGTTNLVAHYKCEEGSGTTAYDSSGNGYHGTMYNTTPSTFHATDPDIKYSYLNEEGYTDSSGVNIPALDDGSGNDALGNPLQYTGRVKYNADLVESNCATFDGVDDYVQLPSYPIDVNGKSFSIGCWFKINVFSTFRLIDWRGVGAAPSLPGAMISATPVDGTWKNTYIEDGTYFFNMDSVPFNENDGKWHFVVLTFDTVTGVGNLYIDGIYRGNGSNSNLIGANLTSPYDPILGSNVNGHTSQPFNGDMAGAFFYNRVLTSSEIYKMYSEHIYPIDVKALYPLSEGTGTTIYDVSGNGNHGTAYNITESSFWGSTQDVYHYNITKGFTLSGSTRIPALLDGSADASGGTLTNPAGNFHNNAETKLKMSTTVPALRHSTFWYDAAGNPQARSYSEIVANWNIEDITFADVSIANEKKNIVTYDSAQVDPELSQIKKYLNQ